jgi:hypothetical protein
VERRPLVDGHFERSRWSRFLRPRQGKEQRCVAQSEGGAASQVSGDGWRLREGGREGVSVRAHQMRSFNTPPARGSGAWSTSAELASAESEVSLEYMGGGSGQHV